MFQTLFQPVRPTVCLVASPARATWWCPAGCGNCRRYVQFAPQHQRRRRLPFRPTPQSCAASITPPLDNGDRTANFTASLTVVPNTTFKSLDCVFHWQNPDPQVGNPSYRDVQSVPTPPSPTYSN